MKTCIVVNRKSLGKGSDTITIGENYISIGGDRWTVDELIYHAKELKTLPITSIAYGLTGSGKTLCIRTLINRILNEASYPLTISAVEIYNEKLTDLLGSKLVKLGLLGMKGESQKKADNKISASLVIDNIFSNRQTRETRYNTASSRSHCIIKINNYTLYDLAGSEKRIGEESGYINSSLLALSRVITSLAKKEKHIPYRDSLLTLSMKDVLTSRDTKLFCCVRCDSDIAETISSLNHTIEAKSIVPLVKKKKTIVRVADSDILDLEDECDKWKSLYFEMLSFTRQSLLPLPQSSVLPPTQVEK
jgi:hypothetical protein